jgi:Rhs element Vgr protein
LELKVRDEESQEVSWIFTGLVVGHELKIINSVPRLKVELKDSALKLTTVRKSRVHTGKDSAVIDTLISGGGLTPGTIAATEYEHKALVQFHCTDWDFILLRAETNGQWVIVDGGRVATVTPKIESTDKPIRLYKNGMASLLGFEARMDIQGQVKSTSALAWDINAQALSAPESGDPFAIGQTHIDPEKAAAAIGAEQCTLIHPAPLDPLETRAWASANLTQSRISLLRGRVTTNGDPTLKPGDVIEMSGFGKTFNGLTRITGVRHAISRGWRTDIQFGLSTRRFSQMNDIMEAPAAGLLPAVHGLQIGTVVDEAQDPDNLHRVKVKIPAVNASENIVWARMASLYAGAGRGLLFRPEPNDEVVLGFFNDDPRQPVVLGAMHSPANKPPEALQGSDKKKPKGVVTTKGAKIAIDDGDEQKIQVSMPEDAHLIEMSDAGIRIESSKNIEICGKKVVISGDEVEVN